MEKKQPSKNNSCCKKPSKDIIPSDIKGKLEIPDTRERRDGPGGN